MVGERIGKTLYHLAVTVDSPCSWACFTTPPTPSIDTWHQRLAHTSVKKIRKMASQELVNGLILPINDISTNNPCPGCMYGKMKRATFKIGRTRATKIGQLIHSDLCGPMHVATPRGSKYFVLLTDDFSNYRVVYFLKQKSDVADFLRNTWIIYAPRLANRCTLWELTMEASLLGTSSELGCLQIASDWKPRRHTPQSRTAYQKERIGPSWKVPDVSSVRKMYLWSYGERLSLIQFIQSTECQLRQPLSHLTKTVLEQNRTYPICVFSGPLHTSISPK